MTWGGDGELPKRPPPTSPIRPPFPHLRGKGRELKSPKETRSQTVRSAGSAGRLTRWSRRRSPHTAEDPQFISSHCCCCCFRAGFWRGGEGGTLFPLPGRLPRGTPPKLKPLRSRFNFHFRAKRKRPTAYAEPEFPSWAAHLGEGKKVAVPWPASCAAVTSCSGNEESGF